MNKQLLNVAICIFGFFIGVTIFLWLLPDNAAVLNFGKRFAYVYSGFFSILIFIKKVNIFVAIFLESLAKTGIIWGVWTTAKKSKLISFLVLAIALIYAGISSFFGATLIVAMLQ